jgi:hypothetical protein
VIFIIELGALWCIQSAIVSLAQLRTSDSLMPELHSLCQYKVQ